MKSFIAACAAIALIAFGANYALNNAGYTSAEKQSRNVSVDLD